MRYLQSLPPKPQTLSRSSVCMRGHWLFSINVQGAGPQEFFELRATKVREQGQLWSCSKDDPPTLPLVAQWVHATFFGDSIIPHKCESVNFWESMKSATKSHKPQTLCLRRTWRQPQREDAFNMGVASTPPLASSGGSKKWIPMGVSIK